MVPLGSDHMPIKIGTVGDFVEKYQEFRPRYQRQEHRAHSPWCGIKRLS